MKKVAWRCSMKKHLKKQAPSVLCSKHVQPMKMSRHCQRFVWRYLFQYHSWKAKNVKNPTYEYELTHVSSGNQPKVSTISIHQFQIHKAPPFPPRWTRWNRYPNQIMRATRANQGIRSDVKIFLVHIVSWQSWQPLWQEFSWGFSPQRLEVFYLVRDIRLISSPIVKSASLTSPKALYV